MSRRAGVLGAAAVGTITSVGGLSFVAHLSVSSTDCLSGCIKRMVALPRVGHATKYAICAAVGDIVKCCLISWWFLDALSDGLP